MSHQIRIARPVIRPHIRLQQSRRLRIQNLKTRDDLLQFSHRIDRGRRKMLNSLSKYEYISKVDYQSIVFLAFATYIALPTAKIYLDLTIFLQSHCAKLKFPYLSTALIEVILLIAALLHFKTSFILTTSSLAAFNLFSCPHSPITDSIRHSKWSHRILTPLIEIERKLETKFISIQSTLLDQFDKLSPPEIDLDLDLERVHTIPANDHSAAISRSIICSETVPIANRVHVIDSEDFNWTSNRASPIRENYPLDQEGWLFVSHPTVGFETDSPIS